MKQDNRDNSKNWQTTNTGGTNYVGEIHFHGTQPNSRAKPNPKAVLLKAIKTQVKTRLESSLHNRVYIIPSQDKNPNQVEHPWSIDVKSGSKPKVRLPKNTHIITVFDQEGVEGRLLILGQPGAGKTTMLLELAKKLVERAENNLNEPIPILLSLASWQNDQQSIQDWIVAELNSGKYYKVRKDITLQWLEEGEIIPLLDGLDELATERQESCVQKLNEFLQPGNWSCPLVVCSRIEEYQTYSTQLALNTSVELQPFTPEQIQEYLTRTDNHQLGDSLRNDPALMELAQTPLLLNIIVLSCQNLSLDKWHEFKSSEKRLNYLFTAYIEVMLGRSYEGKRPTDEATKHWLGWLSGKLIEQNETEFFIEKMQPTWFSFRTHQVAYGIGVRLIMGLICGLASGLHFGTVLTDDVSKWLVAVIFGLISGLISRVLSGLIFGLIFELIVVLMERQEGLTVDNLMFLLFALLIDGIVFGIIFGLIPQEITLIYTIPKWSWLKARNFLIIGLIWGGIYVLLRWVLDKSIYIEHSYSFMLYELLTIAPISGYIGGLIGSWEKESERAKREIIPNQGIWRSAANTRILFIIIQPIGWIGALFYGHRGHEVISLGVSIGLALGLVGGRFSGIVLIQHFTLRLILYCKRYIPWNYARFLDYATDRLFLQRVGGGYRFMHDLLRQHFATHYR